MLFIPIITLIGLLAIKDIKQEELSEKELKWLNRAIIVCLIFTIPILLIILNLLANLIVGGAIKIIKHI